MPFDPAKPANGTPVNSLEMRAQLTALKALIDAVPAGPQGPQGIPGTPGATGATGAQGAVGPAGPSAGAVPIGGIVAWLKSFPNTPALPNEFAECNGQVLSDAGSPFNGQTLPDLNSTPKFLRGAAASGGAGGSDTHSHTTTQDAGSNGNDNLGTVSEATGTTSVESSLPSYYEVVWVTRVK